MNSKLMPNAYSFTMQIPDDTPILNPGKTLQKSVNIMRQYDILGVALDVPHHAFVITVRELNDAKIMRNELFAAGYICGNNIMNAHINAELTDILIMGPVD